MAFLLSLASVQAENVEPPVVQAEPGIDRDRIIEQSHNAARFHENGRAGYAITNSFAESPWFSGEIDALRIRYLLEDLEKQKQNWARPDIRTQMVSCLCEYSFTPFANTVYGMLLESMSGQSPAKRQSSLAAWVKENVTEADLPVLDYYAAYRAYTALSYDEALKKIGEYKATHSVFRDRIAMLEALCWANQNQFPKAKEALDELEQKYAQSSLLPEALYLQGWVSIQMQKRDEGIQILKTLVSRYPGSEPAQRAGDLLKTFAPKP